MCRFEPQHRFPRIARFLFEAGEQCLANTLPARRFAGVHAFDFGIVVEQRHSAAADRRPAKPRGEKPKIRLEHLLDREAVALLGLVERTEHTLEFGNQLPRLRRRRGQVLDRDHSPSPASR
jgi:hypothetical protein